jgi:hypothetical protein
MQLSECDKILSEKFPGKYRVVQFEQGTYQDEITTKCSVYIEGYDWHSASTFAGALESLNKTTEEPQEIAA